MRRLPLLPSIQTLDQYEQAVLFGSRDALAYLRGIEPLLQLTGADILHVHREIFKDIHPWAGECRKLGQMATVAGYPAADSPRIARELEVALFQTRELLNAALSAGNPHWTLAALAFFHIRFERVHPFLDGNGRSGRVILAAQFEKAFGVLPQFTSQSGYREAIRACDRRDLAVFVNYLGASVGLAAVDAPWPPQFHISPRFLEEGENSTFEEDVAWSGRG